MANDTTTDQALLDEIEKNFSDLPEDEDAIEEEVQEEGETVDGEAEADDDETPEPETEEEAETQPQNNSLDEDPGYRAYIELKQQLDADPALAVELDRTWTNYKTRGNAPLQPDTQIPSEEELLIPMDDSMMADGELVIATSANKAIKTLHGTIRALEQKLQQMESGLQSHDAVRRQSQIDTYVSRYADTFVKQTGVAPPKDFEQRLRTAITTSGNLTPAAVEEKYKAIAFDVLAKPKKTETVQKRNMAKKAAVAPSSKPSPKTVASGPTNSDDLLRKALGL